MTARSLPRMLRQEAGPSLSDGDMGQASVFRRRTLGNAAYAALAQAVGRGSLVVAAVVLSHGLSLDDFAAYGYFQMTVNMLAGYAALGVSVTAARSFATLGSGAEDARDDIAVLWVITLAGALAVVLLLWLLRSTLLAPEGPIAWWHYGLAIAGIVLGVVPGGAIYGLEAFRPAFHVSIVVAAILIGGSILAWSLSSLGVGVAALTLSFFAKSLGEGVIALRRTGRPRLGMGMARAGRALQRAGAMVGPMAAVSVLASSGTWITGRIVLETGGPDEFALFVIGLQWYALGLFVPGIVSRAAFAEQVRSVQSETADQEAHNRRVLLNGSLAITGAALALAVISSLCSHALMALYGEAYRDAAWVVPAYMFAAAAIAPANYIGNVLVVGGRQVTWLGLTIIWIAIQSGLAWLLSDLGYLAGATAFGVGGLGLTVMAYAVVASRR